MASSLRRYRALLVVVALGVILGTVSGTYASFRSTTDSTASSFSSKRIFAGSRSWSFFDLSDAGDSSASDESWVLEAADAKFVTSKLWTTAFASNRYMDFTMGSVLPAGISLTNVNFNLTYSDSVSGSGDTACYYFEVRKQSDNSVVGTYGSTGSPVDCEALAVMETITTSIPAVSTTDIANDMYIRVYFKHSTSKAVRIDKVTVSADMFGVNAILQARAYSDLADTVSLVVAWGLAVVGDGSNYQSVGNWNANFAANRYMTLSSPSGGYAPSGVTLTGATLDHSYKSAPGGDTTCWYLEVYDGATLIGSHGSTGSPISCNATNAFVTDSVSLPELTAANVDTVSYKIFMKVSGGRKSQQDQLRLNASYSLGATG